MVRAELGELEMMQLMDGYVRRQRWLARLLAAEVAGMLGGGGRGVKKRATRVPAHQFLKAAGARVV